MCHRQQVAGARRAAHEQTDGALKKRGPHDTPGRTTVKTRNIP